MRFERICLPSGKKTLILVQNTVFLVNNVQVRAGYVLHFGRVDGKLCKNDRVNLEFDAVC